MCIFFGADDVTGIRVVQELSHVAARIADSILTHCYTQDYGVSDFRGYYYYY
jgi:hypothetical protein